MASNAYPVVTMPVSSQHLLEAGQSIINPFNPVLTSEVEISMDRPDIADDENSAVPERLAFKEPRISFGLTPVGLYFATVENIFDLATRFQDHVTPTVLDTLTNREVGIDPFIPESASILLAARDSALALSLEVLKIPMDWSAEVTLHPTLVACGLTAATLHLPGGFSGHIRLPVTNLNPKLPIRLHRSHGFFAVRFFQHFMKYPVLPLPGEHDTLFNPESSAEFADETHINRKN